MQVLGSELYVLDLKLETWNIITIILYNSKHKCIFRPVVGLSLYFP